MKILYKMKSLNLVLRSYWTVSKLYTVLYFIRRVFSAVLTAVNHIYLLEVVFELMEGVRDLRQVVVITSIIISANILNIIVGQYFDRCYAAKTDTRVMCLIQNKLFNKAIRVDYSFYDNSKFYDDFHMMIKESGNRPQAVVQHIGDIVYSIVNLFTVMSIVFQIDIFVVAVIVLAVICSYFADVCATKKTVQREIELAKDNKKIAYYKRIFYLKEYIEEIKMKKDISFILEDYEETINEKNAINSTFGKWIGRCKLCNGVVQSLLISFSVYFILVYDLFIRTITIGGLSALLGSIWSLTDQLQQLISHFAVLGGDAAYMDRMIAFLEQETSEIDGIHDIPSKALALDLKDVSFSYDGKNTVLQNVNLSVEPGQKVAIVGDNGAGKTTLINLIMGLYSHYSGSILLDGVEIEKYKKIQRKDYFQCLSQDYRIYAYSIKENICMGNDFTYERILSALNQAGFSKKLGQLKKGIETILTKEYQDDGVNLSGGEKHMIAMARILVSDSFVVCLDEPSSDLDPVGERNFNSLFMSAFNTKTVIFISHRFYATQNVDKIYMLSDGRIIEQGTHDELIELGGRYADMYRIQKQKFLD